MTKQTSQFCLGKALPRDPGLDFIRALSVICMTVAHFSYHVPPHTLAGRLVQFFAELAPPLFFVSFGMTFDRFFSKGPIVMRIRSRHLFYLALCVNLLFHKRLLASDFFWFLWFWQAAVALAEFFLRPLTWFWATLTGGIAVCLFVFPFTAMNNIFSLGLPGSFPILPWGGFVLAGIVFSRVGGNAARDMAVSGLVLLLGIACGLAGAGGVWKNLILIRWPMSGPYFLVSLGLVIFLASAVRHWKGAYYAAPGIARALEQISRNLLLFVVMHFAACLPAGLCIGIFNVLDLVHNHAWLDAPVILAGGMVSVATLILMVHASDELWPVIRDTRILSKARKHFDGVAVCMISALMILGESAGEVPTAWTFSLTDTAIWLVMWYYALEIKQWKVQPRT